MVLTRLRTDELAYTWMDDGRGAPLQLALLGIFDAGPFGASAGAVSVDGIRDELAARAARVPALGRRVVWTRPGEGRPVWAADPAYDPRNHIAAATLPAGADLGSWAATRAARPVAPDRPLWRAEVIDGVGEGRFGLLLVMSHVLADGLAAITLAGSLFDRSATTRVTPPAPAAGVPLPSHAALIRDEGRRLVTAMSHRHPPKRPAAPQQSPKADLREVRAAIAGFRGREPDVSLPRRFGRARQLAAVRCPLADVEAIGRVEGATVNDVVLAAVSGGLRRWLLSRGPVAPDLRLRCSVPATIDRPGRQVASMLVVPLPVGECDPLRRLCLIHQATATGKHQLRATGKDFTDLRMPLPVARWFLRTSRRLGSHRLTLSVTDVPGPAAPLWLAGARMLEAVPIAPVAPLVPLSVAALSYAGELTVTINADVAVPGLDIMAAGLRTGLSAPLR